MSISVRVTFDTRHLRVAQVREEFKRKFIEELRTTGLEVETAAKMTLTTKGHVVTGRLRSSIHTEYQNNVNYNYSDNVGNSFNGSLRQRPRSEYDVIVGSNVVYAMRIERLDAYLFPALERSRAGLQRRLRNIINTL